jgi:hypothetical protein
MFTQPKFLELCIFESQVNPFSFYFLLVLTSRKSDLRVNIHPSIFAHSLIKWNVFSSVLSVLTKQKSPRSNKTLTQQNESFLVLVSDFQNQDLDSFCVCVTPNHYGFTLEQELF